MSGPLLTDVVDHGDGLETITSRTATPVVPSYSVSGPEDTMAQGREQRHQDARTGSTDRMAQGTGAAVNMDVWLSL